MAQVANGDGFAAGAGARIAGPAGLNQQVQAREQADATGQPVQGAFAAAAADRMAAGPVTETPGAPRWSTGGQSGDTANAFDNEFYDTFFAQQKEQADAGQLGQLYQRKDFTGVVTYDGSEDAAGNAAAFGDVYENGRKVGNLYETYDRPAADSLMADLTLDPETRRQAYSRFARDPEALSQEVQRVRGEVTTENRKFLGQQEYADAVDEATNRFEQSDGVDEALTILGGAAGGAAVGAGAGALFGGVGAVPGAIIGGVVGGIGAALNQDEILDAAARTKVQTDMAREQFGTAGAISTGVLGWSTVAGKLVNPLGNVTRGSYDAIAGDLNDGQLAYYGMDENGEPTRPLWMTGLNLAATLGDAAFTFASPIGAAAYLTPMTGAILGEVGQLATQGGSTFSDARGDFDSIFTDDQGDFDAGSAAAGIGKIAIDAVQVATPVALMRMFRGREQAVAAGLAGQRVTAGGFSYRLDDAGRAIEGTRRVSATILAPSEQLTAISTRVLAARDAALRTGASKNSVVLTADDYYRAATKLASGTGRWSAALVTSVGEGYEEFVQAVLEPLSHDDRIDWRAAYEASLQGAAMGAGMYLGASAARRGPATADERLYAQAVLARRDLTGDTEATPEQLFPKSEWGGMRPTERRQAAALTPMQTEQARVALDKLQVSQKADQVAGVWAVEKVWDAVITTANSEANRAGRRSDGSFVITILEDADWPGNTVGSSFDQTVALMVDHGRGLEEQVEFLTRTDLNSQDSQVKSSAQSQLETLNQVIQRVNEYLTQLRAFKDVADRERDAGDRARHDEVVRQANAAIRAWFEDPDTTGQRAATLLFVRNPTDQTGSYQAFMPQVVPGLSWEQADNTLQVSTAVLQGLGGDFDGDKIVYQGKLVVDGETFQNLRTGRNLIGTMGPTAEAVNIGTREFEEREVQVLAGALHANNVPLNTRAAAAVAEIGRWTKQRYEGYIPSARIDRINRRLAHDLRTGNTQGRDAYLSALAREEGFWKRAREFNSNEPIAADGKVQLELQRFQRFQAVQKATDNPVANTDVIAPTVQSSRAHAIKMARAATEGQDLGLRADGWSLFRMFQKLHYSVFNAQVVGSEPANLAQATADLTTAYEALSQGATREQGAQAADRDNIAAKVLSYLQALAAESDAPTRDLVLLGSTSMGDAEITSEGDFRINSEPISMVQLLLRQAIGEDRRDKAAVVTPELESKWARLDQLTRPGNSGEALVEMLGGQTLWSLLGEQAAALGPQLTLEQFVRVYVGQSKNARRTSSQRMKLEPAYLGRKERKDAPYDWEEITNPASGLTAYRAVVDAVLETGNNRVYLRDDFSVGGRYGDRSDRYQGALVEAFSSIGQAFKQRGVERNPEQIRALLDSYPDFARDVMNLIPDGGVNAVFEYRDAKLYISNWVYEMLAMEPTQAAMHYWRNLILAQWHAKGARHGEEDGDKTRTYSSLDNRWHQLMYRLARQGDGGYALADFMSRMQQAQDLGEFTKYVNQSIRSTTEAPFAAWAADTADFDPDKANGGWSGGGGASTVREAILALRDRSSRLVQEIAEEKIAERADDVLMSSLLAADSAGDEATNGDKTLLANLDRAIDLAGQQLTAMGPSAMRYQIVGSQRSFYPQAHTKGIAPDVYQVHGSFQALADTTGYSTQYERLRDMLISVDAEDLGANPQVLARDDLDVSDGDGSAFSWAGVDRSRVLRLWADEPASRPLIRAMLFPSVYERTASGRLVQQFLTGKSMKELLERNLYPRMIVDSSAESKFTYLSMLESQAKRDEAQFVVQRAVNDILFAHSASATSPLSTQEQEQRADEMLLTVADIMRQVGDLVATSGDGAKPLLDGMRTRLTEMLEQRRGSAALGMVGQDAEYARTLIETAVADRLTELTEQQTEALTAGELDRAEAIGELIDRLRPRMQAVLDSREFQRYRASLAIDWSDPSQAEMKKAEIRDAITARGTTLKTKAPWAADSVDRVLAWDLQNDVDSNPILYVNERDDQEAWDSLVDALTAAYFEDATSIQAEGVAVPQLKWGKDFIRRYWDPSYSYLLDHLLDIESPLVQAAARTHLLAFDSNTSMADAAALERRIAASVLDEYRLAQWSVDIPRVSIEANQRMDASAAADAVAMGGISPRRQYVTNVATERQYTQPEPDSFSTAQIPLVRLLTGSGEFPTTLRVPGAEEQSVSTPVMLMNGRFVRSVTVDIAGEQIPISMNRVGHQHFENASIVDSGLRAVTVRRLQRAVEGMPELQGADRDQVVVRVEYLHPDSQPATPEHYNSIFYGGVTGELESDSQRSVNASLWFGAGGQSPDVQASALGANKKGKLAYVLKANNEQFTGRARREAEQGWETDLSQVIQRKTMALMTNDLGNGVLEQTNFNAVFADVRRRHFVRGVENGEPVLWDAEKVVAWQRANPGRPISEVVESAELWKPGARTLRTMLGETGDQGAQGSMLLEVDFDPQAIPRYRGIDNTPGILGRVPGWNRTTDLFSTPAAGRTFQSRLRIRPALDERTRLAYDRGVQYRGALKAQVHEARDANWGDGRAGKQAGDVVRSATDAVRSETPGLDFVTAGFGFIGQPASSDQLISEVVLRDYRESMQLRGRETGWIYREQVSGRLPSDPAAGVITQSQIDPNAKGFPKRFENQIAPDDLVAVEVDSFLAVSADPTERRKVGRERLDMLAQRWPVIALTEGDGGRDLRAELGQYLTDSLGYERVAGASHLYRPAVRDSRYQTQQARVSTLAETHTEKAENIYSVFLAGPTNPLPITENAAFLVNPSPARQVAVGVGLVPVNAFGSFGVPQDATTVASTISAVERLLEPEQFEHLLKLSVIEDPMSQEAGDLRLALERYVANADDRGMPARGTEFGLGDILPLVDRRGRILLYRHGHKAPTHVERQLASELVEGGRGFGVAVYSAEPQPAATVNTGKVVKFETDTQYGLTVQMRVPLQRMADKLQVEGNGMKYVVASADNVYVPQHDLFGNGERIDLVSDLDAALSKESTGGLVNNFRDAFAYFGVDFMPDLTQFFFGSDYAQMSSGERDAAATAVRQTLMAVHDQAQPLPVEVVQQLMSSPYVDAEVSELLRSAQGPTVGNTDWRTQVMDPTRDAPHERIARAVVLYMLMPQARPEHVLSAGGMNNQDIRTRGFLNFMPRIFTEVFDRAPIGDELRTELVRRVNASIDNGTALASQSAERYWMSEDLQFHMHVEREPGVISQLDGYLQFGSVFSAGDNPVLNGQAYERSERQNWSRHSLDMAYETIGARTAAERGLEKTARFAQLRTGLSRGSLWQILNDVTPEKGDPVFLRERPGEIARRQLAYEAVGEFRSALDPARWEDGQYDRYLAKRAETAQAYGLREDQAGVVDFWVRQMSGRPLNETGGAIGYREAMQDLDEIQWNASRGLLPTAGGEVPQIHLHDLTMLFNAAGSRLRLVEGAGSRNPVTSWEGWVQVALGTGQIEHKVFDPMYLLATDGMMHSFQDALDSTISLPVSRDMMVAANMLDETTDRLLQSVNPDEDTLLQDPVVMEAARQSFSELMGAERVGSSFQGYQAPDSVLMKRRAARLRWRKEHDVPTPMDVTQKNFREGGVKFIEESTTTNTLMRVMTNLRVGNALLNPLLWVGAGPEMWLRGAMDEAGNLLQGTSTAATGRAAAAVGLSANYTPQQIDLLHGLYRSLGRRADFKGMVYRDIAFQQPRLSNAGRIERWTHNYAQFASRWQDPTYGMPANSIARRYVEKALEELQLTDLGITPEQLSAQLNQDPTWLQKHAPEVHQAAVNSIAQIRSLRPTPISLMLRGIYEPMSESAHMPVNVLGHLVKLPLLFSGYLMNTVTTLSGMQGFSNMAAMFVEGRDKGLIGRIQAAIKGEEFSQESNYVDMSTALDGVNLAKMFVQGGITHTGLFALGLAAQGLGLTGEDEEERRRRRAAQVQGGQFLYDPRRIQNDFRNDDAVFLDWLPPMFSSWFKVGDDAAMANMPWIVEQFVAPIIGMERFFDTGDPRQILWGFQAGFGASPLFNASSFDDASQMFAELMANADDAAKRGTPDDLAESYGFMVSAVGTLERMMFENAFVNSIYVGIDKYDRDQWKLPMTDSDGEQQVDIYGTPRQTEALTNFVDPETGEIRSGYVNRDWLSATARQLSENRLGVAIIGALTSGKGLDSDFFRQNMVVKQRKFRKPELSTEETEGLLLSVWDSETYGDGRELLTEGGARAVFQGVYGGTVSFGSPALEGVFVPLEMRQEIQDNWMADLMADGIKSGLSEKDATSRMWDIWMGSSDSPYGVGLKDILWSKEIPYTETIRYNQLNTTYVMGPDGMPWATGVSRDNLMNLFGLAPARYEVDPGNLASDDRLNTIDDVVRLNTGMRSLERIDDTWAIPTDEEIGERIQESLEKLGDRLTEGLKDRNGNGWVNYPRRRGSYGRGSYGSGGGYYSGGTVYGSGYVQRMNTPRRIDRPYARALYSINTSRPILRRATLRRQRFASQRGRLNQWQ